MIDERKTILKLCELFETKYAFWESQKEEVRKITQCFEQGLITAKDTISLLIKATETED